jgi:hypothetical protein
MLLTSYVRKSVRTATKTPTSLSNAPPRLALRSTPYVAPDPSNGKGPKAYMYTHRSIGRPRLVRESQTREWWSYVMHKGRPRESVDRGAHPYIAHFLYHFLYIAHTPLCYLQVTSINQYLPLLRSTHTFVWNSLASIHVCPPL